MSHTYVIHDYILYHIDSNNLEHTRSALHMVQIVFNSLGQIWKQFGTDMLSFSTRKDIEFHYVIY